MTKEKEILTLLRYLVIKSKLEDLDNIVFPMDASTSAPFPPNKRHYEEKNELHNALPDVSFLFVNNKR